MTPTNEDHAALAALRNWYARLPLGLAALSDESDRYGSVLRITPRAQGGASVEFHFSRNRTLDFYVGRAGLFDNVEVSAELAIGVCEAARRGRVIDYVRVWRGREMAASTEIELSSGRTLQSRVVQPIGFLPLGRRSRIEYEPWD